MSGLVGLGGTYGVAALLLLALAALLFAAGRRGARSA
jgi:hypothetical protein